MRDTIKRSLTRLQGSAASFSAGQKVIAIIGTAALLLAGFMVFRWASAPSYTPLFSNLAPADASAIIDELDSSGTPYELSNGGATILVPQKRVYESRIALSGAGLPSSTDTGYSLLDNQSLSTSQFKEQTDFKRAMEGELSKTIEAIDGVDTAVIHLALPAKQVFSDQQDPTTASVLVKTRPGTTMQPEQVRAIVNLISASIDGLEPGKVTVADSTGKVLSAPGDSLEAGANARSQQVEEFQNQMRTSAQSMLDRVVGPGNSTARVTANLNFDKTVTETTRYFTQPTIPALAETSSEETYDTPGGSLGTGGVVGPDGQMASPFGAGGTSGTGKYLKKAQTSDNAIDKTVEHREAAPGGVSSLHVGVVLDSRSLNGIDPAQVQSLVASSLGINLTRGDTVDVTTMAFDRTAEKAAAKELAAATSADKRASLMTMLRNGGLILLIAIMLVLAWLKSRKRAEVRGQATDYMVEQLRKDAVERATQAPLGIPTPATIALKASENNMSDEIRDEIAAMVERQPEDVAQLLRGWLVEQV